MSFYKNSRKLKKGGFQTKYDRKPTYDCQTCKFSQFIWFDTDRKPVYNCLHEKTNCKTRPKRFNFYEYDRANKPE